MRYPDRPTRALVPLAGVVLATLLLVVDAELSTPREAEARERAAHGSGTPRGPSPPTVRVRLLGAERRSDSLRCGVDGPWRLVAGVHDLASAPRAALAAGADLDALPVSARGGNLVLNGVAVAHPAITLVPEGGALVEVNGRPYRGTLALELSDDRRQVRTSNLVDLEDYVAGVLFSEMPERFATEAQRAQAVAIRSFALAHVLEGKSLRDDQGSQVYAGSSRETDDGIAIVRSTRGEVVTWQGRVFPAYFHSTCGGRTSSGAEIFGHPVAPPLATGVECLGCAGTRWSQWARTVRADELARLYHGSFGPALALRVERTDAAGRVLALEVLDAGGSVVDRPVADRFRNDYNSGRSLDRSLLSAWFTLHPEADGTRVFGRGFGHGVGLCQYGADGLADSGLDHRTILATYYPGAALDRVYD